MELTAILAKAIATGMPKLIGLAMKKALQRKEIVEFLRDHGQTKHQDEFSIHYVHALAIRSKAGTKEPMLRILGDKDVITAFEETWPSRDLSAFIDKVKWAVDSLAQGDEVRRQAIDVEQEACAFARAYRQAVDEARATSGQETHAVVCDTNKEVRGLRKDIANDKRLKRVKQEDEEAKVLNAYLSDVVALTERIDIQGIGSAPGAGRESLSFAIEEHYTPLTTMQTASETATVPRTGAQALERAESRLLTDLLSTDRPLLIVGDPGSGKSTFLKLIACVLAKDALAETTSGRVKHLGLSPGDGPLTPILIQISTLAAVLKNASGVGGPGGAWVCLEHALERAFKKPTAPMLAKRLDVGRCALLLDGLDEVADPRLRGQIVDVVNGILHHWGKNLIVITSRPFGYRDLAALERMATAQIDDFGEEEILAFLERWSKAMYAGSEDPEALKYLPVLKSAVLSVPRIKRMARNPVMLTCLCVVHWNEHHLPEGKADLLAAVLRWLLGAKDKKRQKRGYDSYFAGECFKALAFAMTIHPEGKQVSADVAWSAEAMAVPFLDERNISEKRLRAEGKRFIEAEMMDSGIVVRDGLGQVRFWHFTFQEHYAGRAISELPDTEEDPNGWWQMIRPHLGDPQWDEVLDHFAGCLTGMGRRCLHLLVERILTVPRHHDLAVTARAVGVLGRLLNILRVYGYSPPDRFGWEAARERVMAIFTPEGARKVPVVERIRAAEALGQGGDERFSSVEPVMLPIPDRPDVLLSKYPVTVQEYQCFVDNGGYDDPRFWGEWWDKKEWREPEEWDEQLEHRNRPVIGISWYEAAAYCKWLAESTGKAYRLPADKEWKMAATHPDGREYPWGDKKPSEELLNFGMNVGKPTPVGVYPAGAAPGGHLDMAGNVWEWCEDVYREGGSYRVTRGGSWRGSAHSCRSAYRRAPPGRRLGYLGFRLSRSVP